jgi:hypothetical protein
MEGSEELIEISAAAHGKKTFSGGSTTGAPAVPTLTFFW